MLDKDEEAGWRKRNLDVFPQGVLAGCPPRLDGVKNLAASRAHEMR